MTNQAQRALVADNDARPAPRGVTRLPIVRGVGALPERVRAALVPANEDQEFLPAHLEILETPSAPIASVFIWTLCAMFTAALVWACVAKIDIYAVASGRVQPSGRSKVVQPYEAGKIKAVNVENGSRVKAGDVLIELDPTEAEAEREAQVREFESLEAEIARRTSEIDAIENNRPAAPPTYPTLVGAGIRAREQAVLAAELAQYTSTRASLEAQIAEKSAERNRLTSSITARTRLIALLQERANMRETLVAKAAGTRAAVIDALQPVEQEQTNLAYDKGQLAETEAAIVTLRRRIEQLTHESVAQQMQRKTLAEQKRDQARKDVVKAVLKAERTRLRAPIDGTVQQLAVTTLGQVVTTGQPLLVIVPSSGTIEVEALVLNRDIGFIEPGQDAVVKLEAFPFTRYGTIAGRVVRVSRDATEDKDAAAAADPTSAAHNQGAGAVSGTPKLQNLVFPVTVELERTSLNIDGRDVSLRPGMMAAVEIRTGDRRVIDYLLSSIREVSSTAAHER